MNHKHLKVLEAIFAHPTSGNLDFKEVVHALESLGAEVTNKSGNRVGISFKGHEIALPHGHHALAKEDVVHLKKFLIDRGIDPSIVAQA